MQSLITKYIYLLHSLLFTMNAGEHRRKVDDGTELQLIASNYLVHPKYNSKDIEYDYALLKLEKPVDFSVYNHIR